MAVSICKQIGELQCVIEGEANVFEVLKNINDGVVFINGTAVNTKNDVYAFSPYATFNTHIKPNSINGYSNVLYFSIAGDNSKSTKEIIQNVADIDGTIASIKNSTISQYIVGIGTDTNDCKLLLFLATDISEHSPAYKNIVNTTELRNIYFQLYDEVQSHCKGDLVVNKFPNLHDVIYIDSNKSIEVAERPYGISHTLLMNRKVSKHILDKPKAIRRVVSGSKTPVKSSVVEVAKSTKLPFDNLAVANEMKELVRYRRNGFTEEIEGRLLEEGFKKRGIVCERMLFNRWLNDTDLNKANKFLATYFSNIYEKSDWATLLRNFKFDYEEYHIIIDNIRNWRKIHDHISCEEEFDKFVNCFSCRNVAEGIKAFWTLFYEGIIHNALRSLVELQRSQESTSQDLRKDYQKLIRQDYKPFSTLMILATDKGINILDYVSSLLPKEFMYMYRPIDKLPKAQLSNSEADTIRKHLLFSLDGFDNIKIKNLLQNNMTNLGHRKHYYKSDKSFNRSYSFVITAILNKKSRLMMEDTKYSKCLRINNIDAYALLNIDKVKVFMHGYYTWLRNPLDTHNWCERIDKSYWHTITTQRSIIEDRLEEYVSFSIMTEKEIGQLTMEYNKLKLNVESYLQIVVNDHLEQLFGILQLRISNERKLIMLNKKIRNSKVVLMEYEQVALWLDIKKSLTKSYLVKSCKNIKKYFVQKYNVDLKRYYDIQMYLFKPTNKGMCALAKYLENSGYEMLNIDGIFKEIEDLKKNNANNKLTKDRPGGKLDRATNGRVACKH